jgi:hypothetical protein
MPGTENNTESQTNLNAPLSPAAEKFVAEATAEFNAKQDALRRHWRFGSFNHLEYDETKGVLKLSFNDGSELQAGGQLLGTYSPAGRSLEWAWNNPRFNDLITQASKQVRNLGKHLGIAHLHIGTVPVPSEDILSYYVAIGAKVTESAGILTAQRGEVEMVIAVMNPQWTKIPTHR